MEHGPVVILTKFGQNRPKDVGAVGFWKMSKEEERKKEERKKKANQELFCALVKHALVSYA